MNENKFLYNFSKEPTGTHQLLLNEIPVGSTVLDVGCAGGYLGEYLIQEKKCTVFGIEPDTIAFQETQKKHYAFVTNKTIEEALNDGRLQNKQFTRILLGDVLEHLLFPDQILRQLRNFIAPDGTLVMSIPNVGHYTVRLGLLWGRWDMKDTGILDRTHLHFYTIKTARELLEKSGWEVIRMRPRGDLERWARRIGLESVGKKILEWFPGLFAVQFIFVVIPKE